VLPVRSLSRARGFPALAVSYAINELGDNLGVIALAILVLDRTGSALATTALYLAAKFAPALAAPLLTAGLDRVRVGRALPVLYLLEAAAFAALALLAGDFVLVPALLLAFADGLLALTARGLSRGAVAAVLNPIGMLRDGNALLNVVYATMSVAGPALAGVVVHVGGVSTALWADAASFVAVALLLLATARTLPAAHTGGAARWTERMREGFSYVRGLPTARRLITGEAVAVLFFTVTTPIEVVYVKESLDSSSLGFGVLMAMWGLGILLGSAIFTRSRSRPLGTLVLASTAAVGISYAGMAVAPTIAVACVAAVLGGTGQGVQWIAVMTALQEAVDDDFQARVAGLLESAVAASLGLGFLLGGLVTSLLSPRVAFLVAAAGIGAVVVAWARRPVVPRAAVAS
jgi:MFS family permease